VQTSTNALGRVDKDGTMREFLVPTPNARVRGVTVGADGRPLASPRTRQPDRSVMDGDELARRIRHPDARGGARCIAPLKGTGGCFFTQFDAG